MKMVTLAPRWAGLLMLPGLLSLGLLSLQSCLLGETEDGARIDSPDGVWVMVEKDVDVYENNEWTREAVPVDTSNAYTLRMLVVRNETLILGRYSTDENLYDTLGFVRLEGVDADTARLNKGDTITWGLEGPTLRLGFPSKNLSNLATYVNRYSAYSGEFPPPAWNVPLGPDSFEPDNSPDSAKTILADGHAQERTLLIGDPDWVRLQAEAGRSYTMETLGNIDMLLELYAPDGTSLLARDDDGGSGYNARVEWKCPADGTYYLKLRGYRQSAEGTYFVRVTGQ